MIVKLGGVVSICAAPANITSMAAEAELPSCAVAVMEMCVEPDSIWTSATDQLSLPAAVPWRPVDVLQSTREMPLKCAAEPFNVTLL